MNKKLLLLLILIPSIARAYQSYQATIDGIHYNFNEIDETATVTYGEWDYLYGFRITSFYYGVVKIPEEVTYNNTVYKVTTIGKCAFMDSNSLTSVEFPSTIITIEDDAFFRCTGVENLELPQGLKKIGNQAFRESGLVTITIPNSVTSIGVYAFKDCYWLEKVVGLMNLSGAMFEGCESLTSVSFDEQSKMKTLNSRAFANCSKLTDIELPNSITTIGEQAFFNCSSMLTLTIPIEVESIDVSAFQGCSSLESVIIPDKVTQIADYTFAGCSGLKSISLPNSITSIGVSAFSNCRELEAIEIPEQVSYIGKEAFWKCYNITSVKIPNGVSRIGSSAFLQCHSLKEIFLSKNLVELPEKLFYGCSSITDVYCYSTTPPTAASDVFSNTSISDAILHVPGLSLNAFKATKPWVNFKKIIALDNENSESLVTQMAAKAVMVKAEGGQLIIEGANDNTNISVYTIDGVQVGTSTSINGVASINTSIPKNSVAIVKIGNKSVKIMMR